MNSRPSRRLRLTKFITWAAVTTAAVLVICWIVSIWFYFFWRSSGQRFGIGVSPGTVWVQTRELPFGPPGTPSPPRFVSGRPASNVPFTWHLSISSYTEPSSGLNRSAFVPTWMLFIPAFAIAIVAWKFDAWKQHIVVGRRARAGCCTACGYTRAGLTPDAACPECGSKYAKSRTLPSSIESSNL